MTDRTDPTSPDPTSPDPGELELVERRLRRRPAPGGTADETHRPARRHPRGGRQRRPREPGAPPRPPRWLAPLSAAAAVAVIAGTLYVVTRDDRTSAPPAASTSTHSSAPSASPSSEPSGATSTNPSSVPAGQPAVLPAYFVGPVGGDRPVFRLFREFLPGTVPANATDDDKAKAALDLAMNAQPFSNTDGYLQPWSGTAIEGVTVTPKLITVTLSNAGSPGIRDKEVARVAVQELVWTAQAAVGKGTIPVTFEIADGSSAMFGQYPAADRYNRPASRDEYYQDLAPIWITAPARDQVLPSGKAVVVKGEATVFEANVRWELKRGSTVAKTGFATASVGGPGRGDYSFSLGALAPGSYTIRVFEMSMEGSGKVSSEKAVSFSVK